MSLSGINDSESWSQFTQLPARPIGEKEDAHIKIEWPFDYSYMQNGKAVAVSTINVNLTVVTPESWVVTNAKTDYLLKHEQGHYDITSLGAREFYNTSQTLKGNSVHNLKLKIAELKQKIQKKINIANKLYDAQTEHSQKKQVQQTWDKKIEAAKKNPNSTVDDLPQ